MNHPPRVFQALLSTVADAADRSYMVGDMLEEFETLCIVSSPKDARRWYREQVWRSVGPCLVGRVRRALGRRRFGRSHLPSSAGAQRMDRLRRDFLFAVRTLIRRPINTATAVVTLALGIGANTAIFTLVNMILFSSIPGIQGVDRIVDVARIVDGSYFSSSFLSFEYMRENSTQLDDLAATVITPMAITTDTEPAVHMSLAASGSFFPVLGLTPAMGRFFTMAETHPTASPVVVVTHRFWTIHLKADPNVIGRTINLNGTSVEIIGVTPEGFNGPAIALQVAAFVPLGLNIPGLPGDGLNQWNSSMLDLIGRLESGVTASQASIELSALASAFGQLQGESPEAIYDMRVEGWSPVPSTVRVGVKAFFAVLMALVGLVLVMACLNVASMLLSQGIERRSEVAIRLALGASRPDLIRQLVTEALLLFVIAGTVGFAGTYAITKLIPAFDPPLPAGIDVVLDLGVDWQVFLFCGFVTIAAGLLFSVLPALRTTSTDLAPVLKDEKLAASPQRARLRGVMVGGQVAVTFVLLIAAGLFLRALDSLEATDPGWDVAGVISMGFNVEQNGMSRERGLQFYDEILLQARAMPGVGSVGLAAKLPLAGHSSFGDVNVDGIEPPVGRFGFQAFLNRVSEGYFQTLGLSMLEGRDFEPRDRADQPTVAVINETMAKRLWPVGTAVGNTFTTGSGEYQRRYAVIGVVQDAKYNRLVEETPNFYYLPHRQFYNAQLVFYARVDDGARASVVSGLRALVRRVDPSLPVPEVVPLSDALDLFFLPQRLAAWVAGFMGLIGLMLGSVGVYGMTAFAVAQRVREIGLRVALGGGPKHIMLLMVRKGLLAPAVGMGVGLVAALVLSRFLALLLGSVSPVDPVTFGTVFALLMGAAGVATFLPVRRVMAVDPMKSLRTD